MCAGIPVRGCRHIFFAYFFVRIGAKSLKIYEYD